MIIMYQTLMAPGIISAHGANDLTIFVRVVVPLSKAVMATMVLFYAVGHWNAFLTPLIYLDDRNKLPMQLILRNSGSVKALLFSSS